MHPAGAAGADVMTAVLAPAADETAGTEVLATTPVVALWA